MKNRKWKYIIIYSILAILLITAIDIIHSSVKNDAKYLTEAAYGPFVYHDEIYVFSDLATFPSSHDTDVLDYIHSTFTDYFSIKREFYRAAEASEVLPMLIGDVNDPERNYLKVREDRDEYAVKASVLEKNGTIDEFVTSGHKRICQIFFLKIIMEFTECKKNPIRVP